MTSLFYQHGWHQGALPAPLDPQHWPFVLGLLLPKWASIVVVDGVVILEVGHCAAEHYLQHTGIFFFPVVDIHVGVDGCWGRTERKRNRNRVG